MGQVLYRKYRPKKLAEVVGQEPITTALEHALKAGTISHAYLFTGPRGVGKTSVARILAHEINGLPYSGEISHLDIIEIDAASNRRIDEIRELRDKVHVTPTSGKYKVYIIDEVHMLTREAFNALLKTLEEPPAHVVFVLATTEAHKLPETIISRTQRFTFKPVPPQQVVSHLRSIAKKEKIAIDDDALELLSAHGDGSFRDSISLLDQVRNQKERVTADDVRAMLGLAPESAIEQLIKITAGADSTAVVELLGKLHEQGFEPASLANQLSQSLRKQLLNNKNSLPQTDILFILKELMKVSAAINPRLTLELALLDITFRINGPLPIKPLVASDPVPEQQTSKLPTTDLKTDGASDGHRALLPLDDTLWPRVLEAVKQGHNTLYSVLRMAQAEFAGDQLTLTLAFRFHQKRLSDPRNQQRLVDVIKSLSGQSVTVTTIVANNQPAAGPQSDQTLDTIKNIFGGAELLES